jgi:hypothetical protein
VGYDKQKTTSHNHTCVMKNKARHKTSKQAKKQHLTIIHVRWKIKQALHQPNNLNRKISTKESKHQPGS